MDKVIVIGGGESIKAMDVKEICKRGYSIGVNDAAIYAPVDVGVSMDRRWTDWRLNDIKGRAFYLRKVSETWDGLQLYKCNHETDKFAEEPGHFNGRNSGYVGFNIAYQMRPKKIYLFGFDMSLGYWYPPYPWVNPKREGSRILDVWVRGFEIAAHMCKQAGIDVYQVGSSRIKCFKKLSYEEFLCDK